MKWFSIILIAIFSISYLGEASVYAIEQTEKEWEAPGIEPNKYKPMVPPAPSQDLPHEEDYELWVPPVKEPSDVPQKNLEPTPIEGEAPSVNPEKWPVPEGTKTTGTTGEMQIMPGIAAPTGVPEGGSETPVAGSALLYVTKYGRVRDATWPGNNLSLFVMGLGNVSIIGYIWIPGSGWKIDSPDANLYNPGPNKWSKMWFLAEKSGWHALRAYIGGVPSNWVYIYVY